MPDPDNTFPIPPLSPKTDGTSAATPGMPPQPGATPPGPMPSNDWVAPSQPAAATPPPVAPPVMNQSAPAPMPVQPAPVPVTPAQPAPAPVPQPTPIPQPSIPVDDGLGSPPPGAPVSGQPAPAPVPQPMPPAEATVPMPPPTTEPTNMLDLSASANAGVPNQPVPPPGMSPAGTGLPTDMSTDLMAADAAMLGTDVAVEQPKKSKLKIVIIVALVFVGLILVLSLVLYLTGRSSRKPAIELNETQNTQQTQTQPATDPNAPAAIPEGFVKITRDCYSFGFPADNTIPPAEKSCSLNTKIGKLGLGSMTVVPSTNVVNNLDDLLAVAKSSNKVLSEEDAKINGVAAKKLVIDGGASGQSVKYLVIVKDKGYTLNGKPVQSFDITISTGQDFFKKVADTAISTWQWVTTTPAAATTP